MGTEFFRTTPAQLRQACRGWRAPLDQPVPREVVSATGRTHSVPCWDPEPNKPTPEYAIRDLPGPAIEMEGFEKIAIDALIPLLIQGTQRELEAVVAERQRPPLIHPEEGPWLLAVPPALVAKLAALEDSQIPSLGPRWSAALRAALQQLDPPSNSVVEDGYYAGALRKLVGFARETMTAGHRMYEWYSAPGQPPRLAIAP